MKPKRLDKGNGVVAYAIPVKQWVKENLPTVSYYAAKDMAETWEVSEKLMPNKKPTPPRGEP